MSRVRSVCLLLCAAVSATCSDGTSPPPPITVTRVDPADGPLAGGTAVTITGSNFPITVDSVRVGTGRLGSLERVSATQLTGATPAGGVPGLVDVTVYAASSGSGRCTACFTYNPPGRWTSLTAGGAHTCGLTSSGAAYCWGYNASGELGDGTTSLSSTIPLAVAGGLAFAGLTAGGAHTCGLTSDGAAYCWGLNEHGQLGTAAGMGPCFYAGSSWCISTPAAVAGGLTLMRLTAGSEHTCGLTSDGAAYCWGQNNDGELGRGDTLAATAPVAVAGGLTFVRLAAGSEHTCGLTSGGEAYCWGSNERGQLGTVAPTGWCRDPEYSGPFPPGLPTPCATEPVAVAGAITFMDLTAGGAHTCGLTSLGAAYCWGHGWSGELGTTDPLDYCGSSASCAKTPKPVAGGITFGTLGAGGGHTCALASNGAAYCWGGNDQGQLRTTAPVDTCWVQYPFYSYPCARTPKPVGYGVTFAGLSVGGGHTCALTEDGHAYCWGDNYVGQCGNGRPASAAVMNP